MAKTTKRARTARRRGARVPVKPAPRITTRRAAAAHTRRRGKVRAARGRGVRASARAETLQVTLELRDVSDRLIRDPETFFTFRRVNDRRQIGDQLALELTGSRAVFDLPVATGEIAVCELDPKRFRFAHSPVFFLTPGDPITRTTCLLREPMAWRPRFTRWGDLPAGFAHFKRVLRNSPGVTILKAPDEPVPDLARQRRQGDQFALGCRFFGAPVGESVVGEIDGAIQRGD